MTRRLLTASLLVTVLVAATLGIAPRADSTPGPRPVVFVHGVLSSGNQFDSQAMRFASNGYPLEHVEVLEYDSTFSLAPASAVHAALDDLVDDLLSSTGADAIDLVGHSLGASLMQSYLNSDPARAARVAHYVNVDGGAGAASPPGGVETLAIWGAGDPAREVTGATNLYLPDQTHAEVLTSPESFAAMYELLNGEPPATTTIVREHPHAVTIAGRATIFPLNVGAEGAILQVYEIDHATGARLGTGPVASELIGPDGGFGPLPVRGDRHYELVLVFDGRGEQHFYFEPFVRSTRLIRLLSAAPGEGLSALFERSPDHTTLTIVRSKEWLGDQGPGSDSLTISGTEVINEATAPTTKRAIAIFAFDVGSDGLSDVSAPIPAFFALPFLTGVDLYLPGADPPDETISLVSTPRGGEGSVTTINLPNWASELDDYIRHVTVQFNDFHHTDPPSSDPGDDPEPVHPPRADSGAPALPVAPPGSPATPVPSGTQGANPAPAGAARPVDASPAFTG